MSEYNLMDLSLKELLKKLDSCKDILKSQEESICQFRDIILESPNKFKNEKIGIHQRKIFIGGAGRSGLVAKSYAMRLMQLGFNAYVFGESIIPPIEEGDIIITISNSGKSSSIMHVFDDIKQDKVKILSVCGSNESDLALMSDAKIVINSSNDTSLTIEDRERLNKINFNTEELVLLGTAFEISAFIILDVLVVELMKSLGLKESNLKDMHDNLSSFI
ncbi:MAG: SIS domain-containing protein [Methanosphaera sp.]|nr:SIS domain-containing protein [Methanosphaera sp.]